MRIEYLYWFLLNVIFAFQFLGLILKDIVRDGFSWWWAVASVIIIVAFNIYVYYGFRTSLKTGGAK